MVKVKKNLLFILTVILLALVLLSFNAGADDYDQHELWDNTTEMMNEYGDREYDVDKRVMTFYYPWYKTMSYSLTWEHWEDVDEDAKNIGDSTNYPEIGVYDSNDPELVDRHMEQIKEAGIDTIIISWWGDEHTDAVDLTFDKAEKHDLKATLYYETNMGAEVSYLDEIEAGIDDLNYIHDRYVDHPAYLKLDGDPVLFVYSRVMNQVSKMEWATILDQVKTDTGDRFALIADRMGNMQEIQWDGSGVFAASHLYNFAGDIEEMEFNNQIDFIRDIYYNIRESAYINNSISTATIIPGYDDTEIRDPGIHVSREDGEFYEQQWENVFAVNPDWVLITSWNEWHEGTEIEPSIEYGDKYLDITRTNASTFKAIPQDTPDVDREYEITDAELNSLEDKYQDINLGIIAPDFNNVVNLLFSLNLDIDYLTYEDFIEKDIGDKYDAIFYAEGEVYTQSLYENNDVDEALVQYLNDGGTLIATPTGPTPFYANRDGESLNNANNLGFSIHFGETDEFPEASDSNFKYEVDISGIDGIEIDANQIEYEFPEETPRWRYSREPDEGSYEYHSILGLYDSSGNYHGDAVALISYKDGITGSSEYGSGNTLSIWFGLLTGEKGRRILHDSLHYIESLRD